ncbi:mitochondrial nucleoid-associated protein 1-like [Urocitellus parryii]
MYGSAVSHSTSCERIILGSADTESWEENSASPVLGLRVSRFVETQVRGNQNQGFGLGAEACGSKEKAEESVSATEMQEWAFLSHGSEHFITGASATEEKLEDAVIFSVSHIGAADRKILPNFMGLKWFPELHLGSLGLGVLQGKPKYWNSIVHRPQLSSPQGQSLSQVPLGWIWCNTTVRKSGVGGITMLFTGYFTLCCSQSFWPLKVYWHK